MINAVREWKLQNNQPVTITVGSICASMASAIVVFAADKVRVHQNSKIMFHGASTETMGGEGAHQDASELLGRINAEVKTVLVNRFNLSPEQVEGWFSEGRMGWIDSKQALEMGLADEIIGVDDSENKDVSDVIKMAEQGMELAACFTKLTLTGENKMIGKIREFFALDEKTDDDAVMVFLQGLKRPEQVESAYDEGLAAGIDKGKTEMQTAMAETIKGFESKISEMEQTANEKAMERETLAKSNVEMSEKIEGLTVGLNAPSGEPAVGLVGFFATVDGLVDSGMAKGDAIIKVQRDNPELYKSMLAEANRK